MPAGSPPTCGSVGAAPGNQHVQFLNKENTELHRQATKKTRDTLCLEWEVTVLEKCSFLILPCDSPLWPAGVEHTRFCPSLGLFSELEFLSGMFPQKLAPLI